MAARFFAWKRLSGVLSILATLILWSGWAGAAAAEDVLIPSSLCHAVSQTMTKPQTTPPGFTCKGKASGYQAGSVWLRTRANQHGIDPNDLVLKVHSSRFDRLEVAFTYTDGRVIYQHVRGGDFGTHWRTGGQIAFEAPVRDAPVRFVTMRFDRLASVNLLRMRLLSRGEAAIQSIALAICVTAALTLLLLGAVYNTSLALALRRQFPVWQAAWAGSVLLWGVIWSQLGLLIVPQMAGTLSSQTCTMLSCLAVTFAACSAITALDGPELSRAARWFTLGLAGFVSLLGVPMSLMRSGPIDAAALALGITIIALLVCVAGCLIWAWRHGSIEARSFAGAWSIPILTLGGIEFIDTRTIFWGGGSQLLILFAAAWQTVWLAVAASRTHAHMRIEHDRARQAEAQAHELARRDPLTGLRNRRGFVEAVAPMLELAHSGSSPAALLLFDIDMFKRINDTHGHDAGDTVLATIARRIERWEGPMCKVARLGGEEFALMTTGMDGFALEQFAESVRMGIAACDHHEAIGPGTVTVSIGVAQADEDSDFRELYRLADEALYRAKRLGRDRVMFHSPGQPPSASIGGVQVSTLH
ncbi:diguanylate cyclase [Novosphingobium album (ex Hu et al. 2023)]|uniref:diguanylate cyclase n=1 Tax=Novosphingobium album (ex Hu et al. 2023) TaxID=2930093 RepID=A0ABT0AWT2_9SPHN|nr:diguanylate cyclase [Novosphingobium album (ex Hu et al. 2023)]MCJ2177280.1 diguanylate cyclase [Novosphingobium album (ex Hu et al. 2023)]